MSEKRFEVLFYGDVINCVRDETGKEYNLHETIDILMDQQATIEELQEENKQLKLTLSEYGVDLKAFEIFKQKIGYYDKVIDDE